MPSLLDRVTLSAIAGTVFLAFVFMYIIGVLIGNAGLQKVGVPMTIALMGISVAIATSAAFSAASGKLGAATFATIVLVLLTVVAFYLLPTYSPQLYSALQGMSVFG